MVFILIWVEVLSQALASNRSVLNLLYVAMDWMFVYPPLALFPKSSYVETLTPRVVVFEGGDLGW